MNQQALSSAPTPSPANHSFLLVKVRPAPNQPPPANALHHLGRRLVKLLKGTSGQKGFQTFTETPLEKKISQSPAGSRFWGVLLTDAASSEAQQKVHQDRVQDLLKQIDQACARANGFWQLRSHNRIGCAMPGVTKKDLEKIASSLQAKTTPFITLTIGMAVFPTLDYPAPATPANAEKALEHALLLGPGQRVLMDSVSLNVAGDCLYREGLFEAARDEFLQGLLLDAQDTNILNSLGVCYGMLNQYPEARIQFQKTLEIDPKEGMAHFNLGILSVLEETPEAAATSFANSAPLLPDNPETWLNIGRAYLQIDRPESALAYLKKYVEQLPSDASGLSLLGQSLYGIGRLDKAKTVLKKTLRQAPQDAGALSALGALLTDQADDLEIAALYCKQSVALDPQNGLYHLRLGQAYQRSGSHESALPAFKEARKQGQSVSAEIRATRKILQTKGLN